MSVPDFQTIMLPLLQFSNDDKEHAIREAVEHISNAFSLTEEERREMLPSGTQFRIDNRVAWAKSYLAKALLLEKTKRSFFRITNRGKEVLAKKIDRIDLRFLNTYPEFRAFRTKKLEKLNAAEEQAAPDENKTPLETFDNVYQGLLDELSEELLQSIKSCSPRFFERLVVELLIKMGYGGSLKDAGRAIGQSGDGGIDGIIKEDKLGLDVVYIQAKRWENVVGRPEIHKFVGALAGKRANKGVFITTSSFTKDALQYVETIQQKIILIDGDMLTQLMIDHEVGTTKVISYDVKKIDLDYFAEE